jgi:capsular exopolysaccharide synthesis family protein
MEELESQAFDPRRILAIIIRRWRIVLIAVVVFAVPSFILASVQTKMYAAKSEVVVSDPSANTVFSSSGSPIRIDPARTLQTQVSIAESPEVRSCTDDKLGSAAGDLASLTASDHADSDVLSIRATSHIPAVARDGADAALACLIEVNGKSRSDALLQRADELRQKALALEGGSASADQIKSYVTLADQAEIDSKVVDSSYRVIRRADLPTSPFAPNPFKNSIVFGFLGLLVGIGVVFVVERIDDRIGFGDADGIAGTSLLVTVPLGGEPKGKKFPDMARNFTSNKRQYNEAIRSLAATVKFTKAIDGATVFGVTSSNASEGKSSIAANLAYALAADGNNVVLVSADLRRPTIGAYFGVVDAKVNGLSSVLTGTATAAECIVRHKDESRLLLMPSGKEVSNPGALLGSERMGEVLQSVIVSGADFVIIDTAPLVPVSDTLSMVRHLDRLIMVAVPGRTGRGVLTESIERVNRLGGSVLGVLLNGFNPKIPGYYYGYAKGGYTYGGYGYGRYGYGRYGYGRYGYGRYGYGRYGYGRYGYGRYGYEVDEANMKYADPVDNDAVEGSEASYFTS